MSTPIIISLIYAVFITIIGLVLEICRTIDEEEDKK